MSTTSTGRRVVSVLFADLAGFTALSERLDPEDVARIQDHYFALAADAVGRHGGQVEKFIGDAVMAVFGVDRADDTDPVRAVRAARHLATATEGLERELGVQPGTVRVRIGVNTGEVVVTRTHDGGWRVTGDPVNTAARLQSAAAPGQVLLGPETAFGVAHAFVVEDHERLPLKGKAEPLRTWRVVDERPEPRRGLGSHGLHAPLLGRDDELALLHRALCEVEAGARSPGLVLAAPPGVGKSRLVEEFCAAVAPAGHPTLRVRLGDEPEWGYTCVARLLESALQMLVPGGAALPAPARSVTVADLAAALLERGWDLTRAEVAAGHTVRLLAGEPLEAEPVDLYGSWTAVLDAIDAPVPIWVVEDFHLAEPDLRAFVGYVLGHRRPDGRLVIVTARPTSGLEAGSTELAGVPVHHLEALSPTTTRELITALVGAGALPERHLDAMVAASGGNPLFIEELLRSWIQSGVLHRAGDRWVLTEGSADPVLPSTVQAIYRGQLDALPAGSRAVVECGSVPGLTFPSGALPVLGVLEPERPLEHLTGAGLLVGPHEHAVTGHAYTYRHTLLRDAAYGSLARQLRAELHVHFARWLATEASRTGRAAPELVGHHLACAVEVLPAMAPGLRDGTSTVALADEAAALLEHAAQEALVPSPQRSAALLQRALELPGTGGGPDRLRRRLLLGEAERRSGRVEEAMLAFAEAGDAARVSEDDESLVSAALGYENALFASRLPRSVWGARSVQLLRAAESVLPAQDRVRRSMLLADLGRALVYDDDAAAGADACRRAVALAESSGDAAALARALLALRSAQSGPSFLAERLRSGQRVVQAADRTDDGELQLEAVRLRMTDLLASGDIAGADEAQARATELIERLGRPLYFWYPPMWRSMRALLAGRYAQARSLVDQFRVEARRAHYGSADQVWAAQTLRLHLETSGAEQMMPMVERLAVLHPPFSTFAAPVLARAGDRHGAQEHLDRCTADDFAALPDDLAWSASMAHLAEAAAALGDGDTAARIAQRLLPWAGQHIVVGAGALCMGAAAHYVGIALRTAHDAEGARMHLLRAVQENESIGAPSLAARSRAELSVTMAGLGHAAEARALADRALDEACGLGMVDLADDLRARLASESLTP